MHQVAVVRPREPGREAGAEPESERRWDRDQSCLERAEGRKAVLPNAGHDFATPGLSYFDTDSGPVAAIAMLVQVGGPGSAGQRLGVEAYVPPAYREPRAGRTRLRKGCWEQQWGGRSIAQRFSYAHMGHKEIPGHNGFCDGDMAHRTWGVGDVCVVGTWSARGCPDPAPSPLK